MVIDTKIIEEAIKIAQNSKKKIKFNDLLIAATAKYHHKTLITSDKDFLNLQEDIKILTVNI